MTEDISHVVDEMYESKEQTSDGLIIIGKCCPKALKALKQREKNIVSINRNSTNYEVDEVLCDGHKIISRVELEGTLIVRESCRPISELSEPEYYI